MHSADTPRFPAKVDPSWRIGLVHSCFHEKDVMAMAESAKKSLIEGGIPVANISLHPVAGSFEIPLIGSALAKAEKVDALIGLGIIVEGETHHADLLAGESARGIMQVQLDYGIPFAFEILYVDNLAQAQARADKGAEAAYAALHSLAELHRIRL